MSHQDHYRKLASMYSVAPIQSMYPGTRISIEKGVSVITMPLRDEHHHAAGAMHGSVYFRLLDDAAFFAANSLVEKVFVLTTHISIQLIRPCTEGILTSRGSVVTETGKSIIAESKLYNEAQKIIAIGSGTFQKSQIPLSEDIGYR